MSVQSQTVRFYKTEVVPQYEFEKGTWWREGFGDTLISKPAIFLRVSVERGGGSLNLVFYGTCVHLLHCRNECSTNYEAFQNLICTRKCTEWKVPTAYLQGLELKEIVIFRISQQIVNYSHNWILLLLSDTHRQQS